MNPIPQLDPIATPKAKFTLLVVGGGMMGCDVRKPVTSKGWIDTHRGRMLCYSEPRGRKLFGFLPVLQRGAIVLRGHEESRPLFEPDARSENGVRSFIMNGVGGRFIDYDNEGTEALLGYLKKHLVLHTLTDRNDLTLLKEMKDRSSDQRAIADPDFKRKLLEALGPPVQLDPAVPAAPARKELLTDKMKEQLVAANGKEAEHPLFKIFSPEGAATWVLFSMEDDGDTLWAACDLGMGMVEYGTVGLHELETGRGARFKLPFERDRHFDGKRYTLTDLLDRESLAGC